MPVRVVVGRFDPVVESGIRALLGVEADVRVVSHGLEGRCLRRAVSRSRPGVVILNDREPIEEATAIRALDAGVGVVVLARAPSQSYGRRLLASGISCVSLKVTASDLVDVVRRATGDVRVFVSAAGTRHERRYPSIEDLTDREAQVAKLVGAGRSDADIAAELGVGVRTVHSHVASILRKLQVDSRRALIGHPASEQDRSGRRYDTTRQL